MRSLLRHMDIEFERVSAVDGAALAQDFLDGAIDRSPCRPHPSPTEVGCFLSHRLAWERVAHGSEEYGLVLEDDVIFARNFAKLISSPGIFSGAPDLIRLEGWKERVRISSRGRALPDGYKLHRMTWDAVGSACYVLSKVAARKLLDMRPHYTVPVDVLLFRSTGGLYSEIDIRAVVPAASFQYLHYHGAADGAFASTVLRPRPAKSQNKKPIAIRICNELARNVRKFAAAIHAIGMKKIDLHPCGGMEPPGADGGLAA